MTLADRKTPETDAVVAEWDAWSKFRSEHATYYWDRIKTPAVGGYDWARVLERERDAALEALTRLCDGSRTRIPRIAEDWEFARATLRAIEESRK